MLCRIFSFRKAFPKFDVLASTKNVQCFEFNSERMNIKLSTILTKSRWTAKTRQRENGSQYTRE